MNPHDNPGPDHVGHDRESLSALFDGELRGDASRFALKRLGQDAGWRRACGHWQLAGDVLRGQAMAAAPAGFAARVSAALASEATQMALARAVPNTPGPAWRRGWVGGAAIAASVAVAALLVARPFDESRPGAMPQVSTARTAATPAEAAVLPATEPASPASLPDSDRKIAAVAVEGRDQRRLGGQARRADAYASLPAESPTMAVADAPASAAIASSNAIGEAPPAHPFQLPPATIASKPWPRAVLPNFPASSTLSASYGTRSVASPAAWPGTDSPSFYPFEPRLPQGIGPAAAPDPQHP